MESKNCVICDETMTAKKRVNICCIQCNKKCCNKCFTTFLMIEPTCMFCKEVVSEDFISKNTTKTFFNNYSKHKRLQFLIKIVKFYDVEHILKKNRSDWFRNVLIISDTI